MSPFWKEFLAWVILIAIIWDTLLTAYLLRVFLVLKRKIIALERSGKAYDVPRLD